MVSKTQRFPNYQPKHPIVSAGADDIDGQIPQDQVDGKQKTGKDIIEEEEEEEYVDYYNCRPPPIVIPLASLATIISFIIYAVEIKKREAQNPSNKLTFTTGEWHPNLSLARI